jgi:lysozyme
MNLRDQLIAEEGYRNSAYLDTLGIPTIGVGHTGPEVHLGLTWTDEQVNATLDADIAKKTAEVVYALPWFGKLNEPRQAVLLQMAFQMGTHGLLGFPRTLAAVHDGNWDEAANGMLMSKWAEQTPARARRLSRQMRLGTWIDSNGFPA